MSDTIYEQVQKKSIQQRQIAASTYHAAESLSILESEDKLIQPNTANIAMAQVHATLSLAAATRAMVTL